MKPLPYQGIPFAAAHRREGGAVLVLFAVAMLVIIAMAGMALDGAHGMLNKTRLQNAVDAAALSAAKTLVLTEDSVLAEAEAIQTFAQNAALPGNAELAAAYTAGDITLSVTFSEKLHPFVPATVPEKYVRVAATDFRLPAWFIRVLGFNEQNISASAVSGPQVYPPVPPPGTEVCNITPMMVCGDPTDLDDPNDSSDTIFGYTLDHVDVLKQSAQGQIGPGNFQLFQLGDSPSGAETREGMAGAYNSCLTVGDSATLDTTPGNKIGPAFQGLNTRFGLYQGGGLDPSDYPSDVVTTPKPDQPFSYEDFDGDGTEEILYNGQPFDQESPPADFYDYYQYKPDVEAAVAEGQEGTPGRRLLAVAVGDCSEAPNGQTQLPLLGFLCYFLVQQLPVGQGNDAEVFGQFISADACLVNGSAVTEPPESEQGSVYRIVLYKDESAEAS